MINLLRKIANNYVTNKDSYHYKGVVIHRNMSTSKFDRCQRTIHNYQKILFRFVAKCRPFHVINTV